ncbi:MAG: low affinity iron permease family protein [Ginsengibacter sp.]
MENENREKPKDNPEKKKETKFSQFFNRFSITITKATGSPYAFIGAMVIIIVWGITGPIFHYSDTWQLVINTGTTIVTFLMVFIIQHSQNKDTTALQLKLDELIAASKASNNLINVEDLTEEELEVMKKFYSHLSGVTKQEKQNKVHSLEEEKENVEQKNNKIKEIPKNKKR